MFPEAQDHYRRSLVLTASPPQLHVMLLEACIRHASTAQRHFDSGRPNEARKSLLTAQDIVSEIVGSLDPMVQPELARPLTELYLFVAQSLATAGADERTAPIEEALRVLTMERDTWRELCLRLAADAPPVPTLPTSYSAGFSAQA